MTYITLAPKERNVYSFKLRQLVIGGFVFCKPVSGYLDSPNYFVYLFTPYYFAVIIIIIKIGIIIVTPNSNGFFTFVSIKTGKRNVEEVLRNLERVLIYVFELEMKKKNVLSKGRPGSKLAGK